MSLPAPFNRRFKLTSQLTSAQETTYPKFVNQQAINAFGTFAAEYADFAKAYAGMNQVKLGEVLSNADIFRRVSRPSPLRFPY